MVRVTEKDELFHKTIKKKKKTERYLNIINHMTVEIIVEQTDTLPHRDKVKAINMIPDCDWDRGIDTINVGSINPK